MECADNHDSKWSLDGLAECNVMCLEDFMILQSWTVFKGVACYITDCTRCRDAIYGIYGDVILGAIVCVNK